MIDAVRRIGLGLLCAVPLWLGAQTTDWQLRTGLQVKQDLPNGFDLSLGYQYRRDHNIQAFSGSYCTADLGYKLGKHLSAVGEFRYATSYEWDKFRFGIGLQWKDKLMKKTDYSVKFRYQREQWLQSWPEIGQFPNRNNFRLKLEVERKLAKRLYLHVSTEPQVRINGREGGFQRIRNIAGLDWEFVKGHRIDLAYYYQPEYKATLKNTNHMLVASYSLDLPKWWKAKKSEPAKQD